GQALQARAPDHGSRHRLQRLLAGGAALHVLLQLFARAVAARGGQEALELVVARALRHSTPPHLPTSSRIIFLTSLRALYTRAIFISSRPAAAAPEHPSSAISRKASHVSNGTRAFTRAMAWSSSSRLDSSWRSPARSSPASRSLRRA